MNLFNGIEAFIQVAEKGSFAGAARQLNLSPSAVSKLVARTEDALNGNTTQSTIPLGLKENHT